MWPPVDCSGVIYHESAGQLFRARKGIQDGYVLGIVGSNYVVVGFLSYIIGDVIAPPFRQLFKDERGR